METGRLRQQHDASCVSRLLQPLHGKLADPGRDLRFHLREWLTSGCTARFYLATNSSVARFDDGFLSAGTTYYHGDQIGSARMISDAHGTAVWEGTFLPFGYEMNASSAENRFKFTGHERDGESSERFGPHLVPPVRFEYWPLDDARPRRPGGSRSLQSAVVESVCICK